MSKGAVLCRPLQPFTRTRDPSLSVAPPPTPQNPSSDRHVVIDIWPDTTSVTTSSPRNRRCWGKQQQELGPHYLLSCATCRRRLSPDRDVYIYRGEIGFCSPECRERRIRLDDDQTADTRHC